MTRSGPSPGHRQLGGDAGGRLPGSGAGDIGDATAVTTAVTPQGIVVDDDPYMGGS